MYYKLYRTPIPERALQDGRETVQAQLAQLGLLDGSSEVETVSGEPADLTLSVQYEGRYADRLALELVELLESQEIAVIPLAPNEGQSEIDGYYVTESVRNFSRQHPSSDRLLNVEATLSKKGTKASHKHAIRCRVTQPDPGNVFGNETTAFVGVPSESSTRARWYDRSFSESVSADVTDTVSARFGDVALYDAREVEDTLGDEPVLVYKSKSYDGEGDVDVGVWDTHGETDPLDADGVVQWSRVFDPAHDPRGDEEIVVENGLVRLFLQDGLEENLRAEQWDDTADDWSAVDLPESDWTLVETDLKRIGAVAVEAQLVFVDGTEEFVVDLRLERGYDRPQFCLPDGSDPMPDGLQELLEPLADESVFATKANLGLVSRKELRR